MKVQSDFELKKRVVGWLVSNGISFHQAMLIYSLAGSLALTIPEAYVELIQPFEKTSHRKSDYN